MRAVGKAGARRRLSGAAHACDTISSDSLAEPRHARRPIVRVGWFSRSHLRSACRDALPASAVARMSGTPMTMRKAIRGHANRVQARARRAAGAKAGRWGRGPDRDPGEGSQVAAARTPPGRVLVSRVRGRDYDGARDSGHRFGKAWQIERPGFQHRRSFAPRLFLRRSRRNQ
jgi:hypothetical protein